MTKKNIGLLAASIFVLVGVIYLVFWFVAKPPSVASLQGNTEWVKAYNEALDYEANIVKEPTTPLWYIASAQKWKYLGDQTQNKKWYERSLKILNQGIDALQRKNTLLLDNAAKVAIHMEDYTLAKAFYREAIEVSPGDGSYYAALAELMYQRMHAPEKGIMDVYNEGLTRVVGAGLVIASRAAYFKSINKFEAARKDYQILFDSGLIDKTQYDTAMQELQSITPNLHE